MPEHEQPEPADMNALLRRRTDSDATKAWHERLFGAPPATDAEPATDDDGDDAA